MTPPLVLASASPRRRALLEGLGLRFVVDPPELDESVRSGEEAEAYVARIAHEKAFAVAARRPDATVLAADTSVVLEGRVLGKPADASDALRMLQALSGRTHRVLTAVVGARSDGSQTVFAHRLARADVTFAEVPEAALRWYVATGEPLDKAGAYAVQGRGGFLVTRLEGSHSGVVGLPLVETVALLRALRHPLPWEEPAHA